VSLPRLLLRLVAGVLVLLVAGLVVADLWLRSRAEHEMAQRIRASTGAQHVSVHIGSFPFLYELAVSKIADVRVVADGVPAGPLRLTRVTVDARQVEVDHHYLIFDRRLRVHSISKATITVDIQQSELAAAANTLDADVSIIGGQQLIVRAFGHRLVSLDLTKSALLPDCTLVFARTSAGFAASCTVAPVPPALLTALSSQAS
jgi:LmeA-like phospholipid-binding